MRTSKQVRVFVTRVNSVCQVGAAGLLGRDVRVVDGSAAVTPGGAKRLRDYAPNNCLVSPNIGTTRSTAMIIETDEPERLVTLILQRRKEGAFTDLLRYRSTAGSSIVALSIQVLRRILRPDWKRYARPIEFLDGVRRTERQW